MSPHFNNQSILRKIKIFNFAYNISNINSLLVLFLADCLHWTYIYACAAICANIRINWINITFWNCPSWTFVNTCSACNTLIWDFVSHNNLFFMMKLNFPERTYKYNKTIKCEKFMNRIYLYSRFKKDCNYLAPVYNLFL